MDHRHAMLLSAAGAHVLLEGRRRVTDQEVDLLDALRPELSQLHVDERSPSDIDHRLRKCLTSERSNPSPAAPGQHDDGQHHCTMTLAPW